MDTPTRMPVIFVPHGAPTLALDSVRGAALREWAATLPRPRGVLVISAHWEHSPLTLGALRTLPLYYDFQGFPAELTQVTYPAPGAPQLAARAHELLIDFPHRDSDRPWDHGVWTPLVHMYPEANVPVLQVSMPASFTNQELWRVGQALAPLRDEGFLLMGSGNLVHNLRQIDPTPGVRPPEWATAFDHWIAEALATRADDALVCWESAAPAATLAHPTPEHLRPLLVIAGATEPAEVPSFPLEGWEWGSLSRRGVQFGEVRNV